MDHVLELIKKKELYFTMSGKDFKVHCLNPDHDDSDPSMRINKVTGAFHCFSCGFKGNLFKHYGLTGAYTSIKVAKLKEKLKALNVSFNGVDFPEEVIPFNRPFRGISAKTLKEFGAFYTNSNDNLIDRIFFPIKDVRGKNMVYVGRHTLSQGNPRYLNYPSGVTMPVYPETFKNKHTSLILVEGIFDMLNVYDKGIENVACTFGTNTLQNNTGMKLLPFKIQGIQKIYLMFDGDKAGKTAMDTLQPLIEAEGYEVEKIALAEDSDPGDLDQESVDSIKEYINNQETSDDV